MASVPSTVLELVERFPQEGSPSFLALKETAVRREFIDPFFAALGWDIDNTSGESFLYKEVIHEDQIRTGSGTVSAPDYAFRLQGKRKFFVEAKKPSVNIRQDPHPARQLRRYAWSANLPLGIVSDFHEFGVYDCRIEPGPDDRADIACEFLLEYQHYEQEWDRIYSLFSKEAVLSGSLERFAEQPTRYIGTKSVDTAFLKDMEMFRLLLASNIAEQNRHLSPEHINYAVQMTLNRILFLRISEDRGIEPLDHLKLHVHQEGAYSRLRKLFLDADDRYNSGLFHFREEQRRSTPTDDLTLELTIDDEPLRRIVDRLYYPCPYKFEMIPIEIMGQVYEQFIGRTIEVDDARHVRIVERPEVKKAGGIYYTPTYIVDYIVKSTLGKILAEKSIEDASSVRVLDIACGSGSFLVGAYRYLLDWHRTKYMEAPEKNKKVLYKDIYGDWQLTVAERKRILINCIYGVDIDSQAVENTKLALLMMVLEGATLESLGFQLRFAREQALPDLDMNIKCGNSLIGPDFYQITQASMLSEEVERRVNVFDWNAAFPHVMSAGGFDAIIGNPPYLKEYTYSQPFHDLKGTRLYKYYQGKMDIWYVFASLSLDLLRENGLHSFIATNNWITNSGASKLRAKILSETQFCHYVDFGDFRVFKDAGIQSMIYLLEKTGRPHEGRTYYERITRPKAGITDVIDFLFERNNAGVANSFYAAVTSSTDGKLFTFVDDSNNAVLNRIVASGEYRLRADEVAQGIVTPQDSVIPRHLEALEDNSIQPGDGIFVISDKEREALTLTESENLIIKPYYTTRELGRYFGDPANSLWIIYTPSDIRERISQYPHLKQHLDRFASVITSAFKPYGLHRARDERFFVGEKIIALRKTDKPHFTYTDFPCYVSQTFYVLKPKDINLKYLTGVLNSRLVHYWLENKGKKQGEALQIDKEPLLTIPIRLIDFSDPADRKKHNSMVQLVETTLDLHRRYRTATTPLEKGRTERRIKEAERQIDMLTYNLYRLTEEDIRIVEGKPALGHESQVQQPGDIWPTLSLEGSRTG